MQLTVPARRAVHARGRQSKGFSWTVVESAGVDRATTRDIRLQVRRLADTVVVTATRSPESLARVTQSVTVVTAHDIDALGATSLADVIRFVPGVAVESSGREGAATATVFARRRIRLQPRAD